MWANPQFLTDLVTFIEEILKGKLNFLCSEYHEKGYHGAFCDLKTLQFFKSSEENVDLGILGYIETGSEQG